MQTALTLRLDRAGGAGQVSGWTKAHELKRLLPWAWKAERLAVVVDA
jgi:hypothetical protein